MTACVLCGVPFEWSAASLDPEEGARLSAFEWGILSRRTGDGAGRRSARIAGERLEFCGACSPYMGTLDHAARSAGQACLHFLGLEVHRLCEDLASPGVTSKVRCERPEDGHFAGRLARGLWARVEASAFRALCACPTCALVRAGVRREVWGDASDAATGELLPVDVFVTPHLLGEAHDWRTGEVYEPEPEDDPDEDPHDRVDRHRRETRSGAYRSRDDLGPLASAATAFRPRLPHEWRFPERHRFRAAPHPPDGDPFSARHHDGRQWSLPDRLAISVRWAALSDSERATLRERWRYAERRKEDSDG